MRTGPGFAILVRVLSLPPARSTGAPRQVARAVVFFVLAVLAGLVGRLTFVEQTQVVLISPLAGLSVLWLANGPRLAWWWDVPALSAASAFSTWMAHGTLEQALVGVLVAPVLPLVVVLLLRRWVPHLWGGGGAGSLTGIPDLMRVLAVCALGAVASTALRGTGLWLLPHLDQVAVAMTWVRNFCWSSAFVVIALLVPPTWRSTAVIREVPRVTRRSMGDFLGRPREALAILAVTALLYLAALRVPLPFAIILCTVWAALRLSPVLATVQALLSGTVALVFAFEDIELLGRETGRMQSAALAQAFTMVLVVTAATVALVTQARAQALARAGLAEMEAARRATLLDAVLAHLHEGVVVIGADGRELVRNSAGRHILDLPEGQSYDEAMPAPDLGMFDLKGRRVAAADLPHALALHGVASPPTDFRVRTPLHPDGIVLEITATPLPPMPGDTVPKAVVNFRDVTEARRERDVLASFAGVVAHDLNNPLTVANGWLKVLRSKFETGPVGGDEALPALERVIRATDNMRAFIDDLLSYAVAENQTLQLTDVDLSAVVEDVASLRRHGDPPPVIEVQPGLRVSADPVLVRQLLDNLVGNAVKYVAPGVVPHVCVEAAPIVPGEEGELVGVRVVDNGIGVPERMRRRIFESFQRAHPEDYAGTGLGLAICRQIVERHGGTITVRPVESGGSEFLFTLPAPAPPPAVTLLARESL